MCVRHLLLVLYLYNPTSLCVQHLYNPAPVPSYTSIIQHPYTVTPVLSNAFIVHHLHDTAPIIQHFHYPSSHDHNMCIFGKQLLHHRLLKPSSNRIQHVVCLLEGCLIIAVHHAGTSLTVPSHAVHAYLVCVVQATSQCQDAKDYLEMMCQDLSSELSQFDLLKEEEMKQILLAYCTNQLEVQEKVRTYVCMYVCTACAYVFSVRTYVHEHNIVDRDMCHCVKAIFHLVVHTYVRVDVPYIHR